MNSLSTTKNKVIKFTKSNINIFAMKREKIKPKDGKICQSNKNNIISIISNKGGVGKTSIACCISLYLSKISKKKTLLLELDCSPGDFGTLFDIGMEMSLEMAIKFPDEYKKYVKSINRDLDVLKGLVARVTANSSYFLPLFLNACKIYLQTSFT